MDHEELSELHRENPDAFDAEASEEVQRIIRAAPPEYRSKLWAIQETWDRKMKGVPDEERLQTAKRIFAEMVQGVLCPGWR